MKTNDIQKDSRQEFNNSLQVSVAVIKKADQYLISKRLAGKHLADKWEFPGGKIEQGETTYNALRRETYEELGLDIIKARPLIRVSHAYSEKKVTLMVWLVTEFKGDVGVLGREGQEVKWASISELKHLDFPAANKTIFKALELPAALAIVNMWEDYDPISFDRVLGHAGIRCRAGKMNTGSYQKSVESFLKKLSKNFFQQTLFVILDVGLIERNFFWLEQLKEKYSGINWGLHFRVKEFSDLDSGFTGLIDDYRNKFTENIGFSCHNLGELEAANQFQASYVFLSPVLKTQSHPFISPLGWEAFHSMVAQTNLLVYALGGVSVHHLEDAWQGYAQGIAGISWWKSEKTILLND